MGPEAADEGRRSSAPRREEDRDGDARSALRSSVSHTRRTTARPSERQLLDRLRAAATLVSATCSTRADTSSKPSCGMSSAREVMSVHLRNQEPSAGAGGGADKHFRPATLQPMRPKDPGLKHAARDTAKNAPACFKRQLRNAGWSRIMCRTSRVTSTALTKKGTTVNVKYAHASTQGQTSPALLVAVCTP